MSRASSQKIHFIFGIVCLIIIITAGTLMKLTTIAEGILWAVFILVMAPVAYLWIRKIRKHDHVHEDHDYNRHWSHKHDRAT